MSAERLDDLVSVGPVESPTARPDPSQPVAGALPRPDEDDDLEIKDLPDDFFRPAGRR